MPNHPPTVTTSTQFLACLAEWVGRPITQFSLKAPPCDAIRSANEDAALAKIFREVAVSSPYFDSSRTLAILTTAVVVHQRRYELAWNPAKGANPPGTADRKAWIDLKPYAAMIDVLRSWLDALYAETLGVAA